MYHCDACGWDGDTPALREWIGEGCGGVVWTLRGCPACGEDVYETVVIREPTVDPERRPQGMPREVEGA